MLCLLVPVSVCALCQDLAPLVTGTPRPWCHPDPLSPLSPGPGNPFPPGSSPAWEPQSNRTPRANCPTPSDTTPGQAGTPRGATRSPPAPRTPQDPRKQSQELHIHPSLDPPSPNHPPMGALDQGDPPQSCAVPPGSHTLPGWGHMGWRHCCWTLFCSSPRLVFPRSSGRVGGPGTGLGQNQLVWSKLGAGRDINMALGTAGHTDQPCPLWGWNSFPKRWVWEWGWPQKWGFCSQKAFSSPPGWMEQRRRGLGWD